MPFLFASTPQQFFLFNGPNIGPKPQNMEKKILRGHRKEEEKILIGHKRLEKQQKKAKKKMCQFVDIYQ